MEPVPRPRHLVPRRARLFAFMLLPWAAACGGEPASQSSPEWRIEVQKGRYGGLCLGPEGGGGCQSVVTVTDDGTWTATAYPAPERPTGSLPGGAASELAAILEDGWTDLTGAPFTDTCPVAYDGQEQFYVIRRLPTGPSAERADADVRELRSCTYDLDRPEARRWIDAFEERWRELGLPE